jgi:hypothetical protein
MATTSLPQSTLAVHVLARIAARKLVQEQLREQGVRVSLVRPAEIAAQAKAYLKANPHLHEEAIQRAVQMGLLT